MAKEFNIMKTGRKNHIVFYELLNKIIKKEATEEDVLNLAKPVAYSMSAFEHAPKNIIIEDFNTPTVNADYSPSTGTVSLSRQFVKDIINGEQPVMLLFSTLAHECQHHKQKVEIDKYGALDGAKKRKADRNLDELSQTIMDEYGQTRMTKEEVQSMIFLLESIGDGDDEFSKTLKEMTPEEKKDFAYLISFSQYFQFSHEIDARKAGGRFVVDLYSQITEEDPLCPDEVKTTLTNQFDDLYSILYDYLSTTDFEHYEKFKSHIEQMTEEELLKLTQLFHSEKKENDKPDIKDLFNKNSALNLAYGHIFKLYFKNKNTKQVKAFIKVLLGQDKVENDDMVFKIIISNLLNNKIIDEKALSENVLESIMDKKINPQLFNAVGDCLTQKQTEELIKKLLLKEDRPQDAIAIIKHKILSSVSFGKPSKDVEDCLYNLVYTMATYTKNFIERIKNGDNDILYSDYKKICYFWKANIKSLPEGIRAAAEDYAHMFLPVLEGKACQSCLDTIRLKPDTFAIDLASKKYGKFREQEEENFQLQEEKYRKNKEWERKMRKRAEAEQEQ